MKNTLRTGLFAIIVATSMVACTPKAEETSTTTDSTSVETTVVTDSTTVTDSTATVTVDSSANTAK